MKYQIGEEVIIKTSCSDGDEKVKIHEIINENYIAYSINGWGCYITDEHIDHKATLIYHKIKKICSPLK